MLFLAWRHLLSRKRQTFFTLMGIVLGATAYVVITGFFLGFQDFLIDQLINNDAHVHITSREDILTEHGLDKVFYGERYKHVFWISPPAGRKDNSKIDNPPAWYARLSADPRVQAYSPLLSTQVILRQAKNTISATLVGCEPEKQVQVSNVAEYMLEGKFADLSAGGNRLILGKGLMDKLGARVSQVVSISTGGAEPVPFKIVGYFKTGMTLFDDTRAYSMLSDVQRVNQTPGAVNDIAIRLADYSVAARMADTWATMSVDKVRSWDQINANFFSVFKIQDVMRYMVIAVILIVAGFGIYNVLNITVTQKQKEIAILRSMGFDGNDVIYLFFAQGFILGLCGGLIGMGIGYWICRYLETVRFGGGPLGGAGYLNIYLDWLIFVEAMVLALFSSSIASILPARAASKLTPIEIIRAGTE